LSSYYYTRREDMRVIKMKNVCAGYNGEEVLHDINLEFEPGEVTVIIGPNGCGKSTLLKTLVRLNEHSSGEILVKKSGCNEELSQKISPGVEDYIEISELSSADLAQRIAYLPQNKRTPDISVLRMVLHGRFAYLKYPRRYRKEDYEMARKALEQVDIEDLAEKNVNELSGGTRQKVYIAMALAQDTDTILLDEPTTYLDIAHQIKMMKLARELADNGKAVVMVLHDLVQGFQTADKIVVMDDGRLRACGEPEEVYASGVVEEVFGVRFKRVKIEDKWRYYVCEE